jgi:hypothetical protein
MYQFLHVAHEPRVQTCCTIDQTKDNNWEISCIEDWMMCEVYE